MDVKKIKEFMELIGQFKHLKRKGWVLHNIPDPETVTGHMYRMAMLSFLIDSNDNVDRVKIMQMTLVHDLAESIVGDIVLHSGISPEEKHKQEDEAMKKICDLLGDRGPMILELFREYENQETPEAQYVKDLDRLDLIMQAYEYEKRENIPGKLEEFFSSNNGKIRHPFINKLADEIYADRETLCRESQNAC